jgi:hypothetical protein
MLGLESDTGHIALSLDYGLEPLSRVAVGIGVVAVDCVRKGKHDGDFDRPIRWIGDGKLENANGQRRGALVTGHEGRELSHGDRGR